MKVLIISHNPITTYQSMGKTFLSLFSEFSKDEICQLYIYPTIPDIDVCSSYYRITDRNVFDSYFHFGKVKGREIHSTEIDTSKHDLYENKKEESFISIKKTPIKTLARDLLWSFSKWYSNDLKKWLEKEKPSCIFLAPGEAKLLYNIALRISQLYALPIVTYICDEFYFVDQTVGFIDKFRLTLLRNKIRQLMKSTSCIVAISDVIKEQYQNEFNVNTETIMTGASLEISDKPRITNSFRGITYLGNLAYDRFSSLIEVGKALDKINDKYCSNYKLFLYTRTLNNSQQECIRKINSIEYMGYVTGDDFSLAINNADALLHVESFAEPNIDKVKNSISTKIADSLASGKPLIAYVPASIASSKYLVATSSAMVINEEQDLPMLLESFIFSYKDRFEIVGKALDVARINHNSSINSKHLHGLIAKYQSSMS